MKTLLNIELAKLNRGVAVVVDDCNAEEGEALAKRLRACDPDRSKFWAIDGLVASVDEVLFVSAPNAILVVNAVDAYVRAEKAKVARRPLSLEETMRHAARNSAGRR